VASSKTRQRKLARAKMERQLARRAAKVRRRRQTAAGVVVAVILLLGITGTVWALGGFSSKKPTPPAAGPCLWVPASPDPSASSNVKDVGTPPTTGTKTTGTDTMTITLNSGTVVGSLDLAKAPCTGASFQYLAGKKFFDNTTCTRLTTATTYLLQCGDPTGTGQGGPAYTFANENVPTPPDAGDPSASPSADTSTVVYPKGTLAMAAPTADQNGSQFYLIYKDSPLPPQYTVFGTITSGLDVLDKIAAAGAVDESGKTATDGKPKNTVTITTLTVTPAASASPSGSASPSASTSPSASPSASAKS
jgi:peptidyl-prolyl cis-trans isomerase B (cyclophilin B)